MMKKLFLLVALVATVSTATMAQESAKDLPRVAGFVQNGFWDNWEVSVGAGIGTAFTHDSSFGTPGNRVEWEVNLALTKWIHPIFGIRGQLQGGELMNTYAQFGSRSWGYLYLHADGMFNISNWIGGYRQDRTVSFVPFFGMGYMASNFTQTKTRALYGGRDTFAFSYGLLTQFRLSDAFAFNIELKGLMTHKRTNPLADTFGQNGVYNALSATVGFSYRFNKRNFERGVAGYSMDDIKAYQSTIAEGEAALKGAKAENEKLNGELNAAKAEVVAAKAIAAKAVAETARQAEELEALQSAPKSVVLFDYGVSKLTPKEKTRLDLMADLIKSGPKDRVYTITGHADQATGSAAGNKRVAEKRAQGVYDYLVKSGVNPDQLTFEGKGNDPDIYSVQKANRAAVIK